MVEIDGGDDGHDRRHGIRGIESAAESDLQHRHIHTSIAKGLEGQRRRRFKERGGKGQRGRRLTHARRQPVERRFGDGHTVDRDALFDGDKVRRDVPPRAMARLAQAPARSSP